MHQEWFEKLAKKLQIKQLTQTAEKVEIILPPELSNRLNGEKLFLQTYNINPKFKMKYQMKRIVISLAIKKENRHYIYDLVKLLKMISDHLE